MIARAATVCLAVLAVAAVAAAQEGSAPAPTTGPAQPAAATDVTKLLPDVDTPAGMSATLRWIVLITVLSLAPAILVMVTCFTRIVVVLNLLRQALAAQQVPPNHVLLGLAVLMTVTVMAPVWKDVHREAVSPYFNGRLDRANVG